MIAPSLYIQVKYKKWKLYFCFKRLHIQYISNYKVFKEQVYYIFDPYADRSSMDENAQILVFWTPKVWIFMVGYWKCHFLITHQIWIHWTFQYGSLWKSMQMTSNKIELMSGLELHGLKWSNPYFWTSKDPEFMPGP